MSQQYCYILYNAHNACTYVGYTNNPDRRLRQHNGHLKGGARYTTSQLAKTGKEEQDPWRFLLIISSSNPTFTKCKALSLEWHIKHETRKQKSNSPTYRRMLATINAVTLHKFADINFTCTVAPSYYETLNFMMTQYESVSALNMKLLKEVDPPLE